VRIQDITRTLQRETRLTLPTVINMCRAAEESKQQVLAISSQSKFTIQYNKQRICQIKLK